MAPSSRLQDVPVSLNPVSWRVDRGVAALGLLALALVVPIFLVIAVRGNTFIKPEGDLVKSLTFDGAIGIYYLTLSFFVPAVRFSSKGHVIWLAAVYASPSTV